MTWRSTGPARLTAAALTTTALFLAWHQSRLGPWTQTMSAPYRFEEVRLPDEPTGAVRTMRAVNPSLSKIAAWISSVGAGMALADLDGDGLANDLCHVDPRTDRVTVMPAPGSPPRYPVFALEPRGVKLDQTIAPMGCLPADLNEDGRMDVLVYYWGRTPVAFLAGAETGPLTAGRYRAQALVPTDERWYSNAAVQADLDGDGHLDLVIGNYFPDGARILDAAATEPDHMQHSMSRAFNGGGPHFLLWAGAHSGAAPAVQYQVAVPDMPAEAMHGWPLAIGAADLDGDLLPELYLANDFGPDRLLHNRSEKGHLRFALLEGDSTFFTPKSQVLGHDSFKGMGIDFADLNGDGLNDMLVSNIANPYGLVESHFTWINTGKTARMKQGRAPFTNQSEALGLARSGWGWDIKAADLNNDGTLEVLQTTGFVKGAVNRWPELQELATGHDDLLSHPEMWPRFREGTDLSGPNHPALFARQADGRYADVAGMVGLGAPRPTRGIAIADVDGDGDLDFGVAAQWGPSTFYVNQCAPCGSFLGLHLLLPLSPGQPWQVADGHPGPNTAGRPAVGATVTLRLPDGRTMVSQVDGGSGHSGKRAQEIFLGLPQIDPQAELTVEIRWRDGAGTVHQQVVSLRPGYHTITLGDRKE